MPDVLSDQISQDVNALENADNNSSIITLPATDPFEANLPQTEFWKEVPTLLISLQNFKVSLGN